MRRVYQYNKKHDEPGSYGHDAMELFSNLVHWNENHWSSFSEKRSIEDQIDKMAEVTGKLCDVLISKGLMTHEEFLTILDLEDSHEFRDNT